MRHQLAKRHFSYFTAGGALGACVIHDPVVLGRLEQRATDEHHQVIGTAIGVAEEQQIAWLQGPEVASERPRVVPIIALASSITTA